MRKEKDTVRRFYDTFGWVRNADGLYNDTAVFVDTRPVVAAYQRKAHLRVKKLLTPHGKFFLDAGSGPIPHPEYLDYSLGYNYRVCLDLSKTALLEARSKLNGHVFCVQGDLAHLPFKDNVFDTTVSAHVLYHIPNDEQETVVLELYRTAAYHGMLVIVYIRPTCFLTKLAGRLNPRQFLARIPGISFLLRRVANVVFMWDSQASYNKKHDHQGNSKPPLYYDPQEYHWFQKKLPPDWPVDIRVWSAVDMNFTRAFVPNNLLGSIFLTCVFWAESLFPYLSLKIGRYPMVIIRKR